MDQGGQGPQWHQQGTAEKSGDIGDRRQLHQSGGYITIDHTFVNQPNQVEIGLQHRRSPAAGQQGLAPIDHTEQQRGKQQRKDDGRITHNHPSVRAANNKNRVVTI